jgi:hypothetical protein
MPIKPSRITDTIVEDLKNKNFERNPPISDLMSATYFDDKAGVFHLKDGRFGLMWEIEPIDVSPLSHGDTNYFSESFGSALSAIPDNASAQYIRVSSRNTEGFNHVYAEGIDEEWDRIKANVPQKQSWEPQLFAADIAEAIINKQRAASQSNDGFFEGVNGDDIAAAAKIINDEIHDAESFSSKDEGNDEKTENSNNIDESVATQVSFLDNVQTYAHEGAVPLYYTHYLVIMLEPSYLFGKFIEKTKDRFLASLHLTDPNKVVANAYDKHLKEFQKSIRPMLNSLKRSGFYPSLVGGQKLVNIFYQLLNPTRSQHIAPPIFNPDVPVSHVLEGSELYPFQSPSEIPGFSPIKTLPNGWNIEDGKSTYYMRCTSVAKRIQRSVPGIIQNEISDFEREGILTINIHPVNSIMANARLSSRQHFSALKAHMPGGDKKAGAKAEEEITEIRHSLNAPLVENREKLFDVSIYVTVGGYDKKDVEQTAENYESALMRSGHYERLRGDSMIYSSLPFNFQPVQNAFFRRHQPYLSSSVGDFCPLYVNFKGASSNGVYFNNRSGTPVFIDLWGKEVKTGHSLVVGSTGTGKSFTFNYLLMGLIAKYSPKIWIIDKGRSYESLCNVVSGNYIELVTDTIKTEYGEIKPISINPFYTPIDPETGNRVHPSKEEKFFLVKLLSAMLQAPVSGAASKEEVSGEKATLLYNAVHNLFEEKYSASPKKEVVFSDLIPILNVMTTEAVSGKGVAEALQLFYGKGPFSEIFDGPLDVDWDNDFTVLETGRMSTSAALPIVMLSLFNQIDIYSKYKLPKYRKKIVAVDEAWAVLKNPTAASALAGFFRELRKYNGACILISQTINDFVSILKAESSSSEGSEDGILENTSHYFLLPSNMKDYRLAESELGFSPEEIVQWKSLSSAPPYFGELFYRMRTVKDSYLSGVLRLCSPSLCLWIATTSPADQQLRENKQAYYKERGHNEIESRRLAIKELAEMYPYGAEHELKKAA